MIDKTYTISFQARFINSTKILKHTEKGASQLKTSFVEITPLIRSDFLALENVNNYWRDCFACNIFHTVQEQHNGTFARNNYKIFALTKQNDNFEKLNDENILGLVETENKGNNKIHINYLQVNPEYVYSTNPTYSKIGSRILDSLKNLYNTITLKPNTKGAGNFYIKNKFTQAKENPDIMIWEKN